MIEIEYDDHEQRPDVVTYCPNCTCISGSHFLTCPECGHKKIMKRQIVGYIKDQREKQYPIKILTKNELINQKIPEQEVNAMSDQQLLLFARHVEKLVDIEYPGIIEKAWQAFKVWINKYQKLT